MAEQRKRLAIFTSNMDGGGAQRVSLTLAEGMVEHGYRVDLVLSRAEGPYLTEVPSSVRIVDLDAGRVLASLPGLIRYLRRETPFAMLTSLNHVNIVGLWARRLAGARTRLVVSEHNTLSIEAAHARRRRHRLVPALARRFYPWADAVVAVSQGTADDLARTARLAPARVHVIHNPIVTPQLREMAGASLNHPWFQPGEPPVLVAVGRLAPQKDCETLIRALSLVERGRGPVRLLILGEGNERARLEALTAELGLAGIIEMPGWAQNPYPYMVRAAAFVLSSRWEGLPSVLIEALFCGPPIISTDCPSGPLEILGGGRHGALVPVGDVNAFAQAIDAALAGNVPRPSPASWRPYEQETIVTRYLEVLTGS